VAEKTMVYGRYNELVFMGIISWFINQQTSLGSPILYRYSEKVSVENSIWKGRDCKKNKGIWKFFTLTISIKRFGESIKNHPSLISID